MLIVKKDTLEVFDASELPYMPAYSHIMFDFGDLVAVAEALGSAGLAILQMPTQPVFDSRYQQVTHGDVVESDGVYSSDWDLQVIDFGDDKQHRKELIAEKRWEEETKPVEYSGYRLHADRDSRITLLSMFIDAKLDPDYNEPEFKTMNGFVSLSNADIIAIGVIVKNRVREAYARESVLLGMIENGDPITPLDW